MAVVLGADCPADRRPPPLLCKSSAPPHSPLPTHLHHQRRRSFSPSRRLIRTVFKDRISPWPCPSAPPLLPAPCARRPPSLVRSGPPRLPGARGSRSRIGNGRRFFGFCALARDERERERRGGRALSLFDRRSMLSCDRRALGRCSVDDRQHLPHARQYGSRKKQEGARALSLARSFALSPPHRSPPFSSPLKKKNSLLGRPPGRRGFRHAPPERRAPGRGQGHP